jgi:hypothetical protein
MSFEGLRGVLRASFCASPVLWPALSTGGEAVACLACCAEVAEDGIGPTVPPPTGLPLSPTGAPAAAGGCRESRAGNARGSAPSGGFGRNSLCSSGMLRVICFLAALPSPAILFVLVPQSFAASSAARSAVGAAAEARVVQPPPGSALAHESTSPHILGPGMWAYRSALAAALGSSQSPRRAMFRARATVEER